MHTPTSSQLPSSSRTGSLQAMLLELDRKIGQISDLKDQITERMSIQEQESAQKQLFCQNNSKEALLQEQMKMLAGAYKNNFACSIKQEIQAFGNEQIQLTVQMAKKYQKQSNMMQKYYEQEISELKQQIQRQYKVMARMKQQVQDLIMLMKCKEDVKASENYINEAQNDNEEESQEIKGQKPNNLRLSLIGNRNFDHELDVIEQETERTLQSSERSITTQSQHKQPCTNYIRIQQKLSQDGSNSKPYKGSLQEDQVQAFSKSAQVVSQFPEKIEENHCYEQFCEDLTPKQSEKDIELPQNYQNQKSNDGQCLFGIESVEKSPEIKYKILPNKGRKQRPTASLTNESKKNGHHESIFFLDEQPQYLNKTAQLKNIDRWKSYELLKQSGMESKSSNNSCLFFKERNEISVAEVEISGFGSQESKLQKEIDDSFFTDHANQQSSHKMEYYLEGYETLKGKAQKQQEEGNSHKSEGVSNEKKMTKRINYFNNQETMEQIFKKFSKVIPTGEVRNSSLLPIQSSGQPLGELSSSFLENNAKNSIDMKPKTKEFLDQFRKTFNKCLNSMQVSKKNSTKIINNSAKQKNKGNDGSRSGVMTFGKSNSSERVYSHSPLAKDIKDKQNLNFGAKRQDGNRFMTGNKKIQVKYEGDKKNGVREGNGVLFYSNGLCYEGSFKNGLRHGFGVLKINHIDIYNGDWINDEIEGSGKIRNCAIINKRKTISSSQGTLGKWISYHGQFKNSAFDGEGTLCLQGGERYVGNFRNGCAFGEGSLFCKNGEVEKGIWQNRVANIGQ